MGVTRGKGLKDLGRGGSEDNNHGEQKRRASYVREEEQIDHSQPTLLFPPWPVGDRALLLLPYPLSILPTSFFLREEEFHKCSKHRAITKPQLMRGWSL